MMRFPQIPTDLIFSDTEAEAEGAEAKPAEATPAESAPAEVEAAPAEATTAAEVTATEVQVPPASKMTGVLDPISGGQIFMLTMFGVVSFIILVAMTRYGKSNNYGD